MSEDLLIEAIRREGPFNFKLPTTQDDSYHLKPGPMQRLSHKLKREIVELRLFVQSQDLNLYNMITEQRRLIILEALRGSRTMDIVATKLGMTRQTLYAHMRTLKIATPSQRDRIE